jgi:hypothetical protein
MKRRHETANRNGKMKVDFFIHLDGSACLFVPLTEAGRTWLAEHCPADGEHHYLGQNLVVGHRYLAGLVEHAVEDGLRPMA